MTIKCIECDQNIYKMKQVGCLDGPICYECKNKNIACICGIYLAPTSMYKHLKSKKHYQTLTNIIY